WHARLISFASRHVTALISMFISLRREHRANTMNPINANQMSASERLDEIGDLLAAGLIRLRARQSSTLSAPDGDSFLDFSPPKSGRGRKPRCRLGGQ